MAICTLSFLAIFQEWRLLILPFMEVTVIGNYLCKWQLLILPFMEVAITGNYLCCHIWQIAVTGNYVCCSLWKLPLLAITYVAIILFGRLP